jgi:ABC-2 type transport system permease protein
MQTGRAVHRRHHSLALYGTRAGQVTVAVLAVLAVTGEYATGLIRVTLAATPRRYRALGAKAAVAVAAAMAAGAVAVAGSLAIAAQIFSARGYTESAGYPLAHLTDPASLRAGAGTVIYFGLIALLRRRWCATAPPRSPQCSRCCSPFR